MAIWCYLLQKTAKRLLRRVHKHVSCYKNGCFHRKLGAFLRHLKRLSAKKEEKRRLYVAYFSRNKSVMPVYWLCRHLLHPFPILADNIQIKKRMRLLAHPLPNIKYISVSCILLFIELYCERYAYSLVNTSLNSPPIFSTRRWWRPPSNVALKNVSRIFSASLFVTKRPGRTITFASLC